MTGASPDVVEQDLAAAMAELDGLAARPAAEHVAVFERIHAALGAALADGPDEPAGP